MYATCVAHGGRHTDCACYLALDMPCLSSTMNHEARGAGNRARHEMKRSWHGWRRAAAGIVGSLVVLLATAAPATEVCAERRPNPAGPHGRNRRPGRAERGRRRRCHQADRLRERRFPPDLRLPAAGRRRAARHLAGERGEVRVRASRETGSATTAGRRSCRSARRRGP